MAPSVHTSKREDLKVKARFSASLLYPVPSGVLGPPRDSKGLVLLLFVGVVVVQGFLGISVQMLHDIKYLDICTPMFTAAIFTIAKR